MVFRKLVLHLLIIVYERMDHQTDRQTDRQTEKFHVHYVYMGLAQARPNKFCGIHNSLGKCYTHLLK